MKRFSSKIGALLISLSLLPSLAMGQAAQTPSPDSPAVRRAVELARVISAGNRVEAKKYVTENFAPSSFLKVPMDRRLDFISELYDWTRGLDFHSVKEQKPNLAWVYFKNRLDGWTALAVRVEPDAPNRIDGIGRNATGPENTRLTRKLSNEEIVKELDAYLQKLAANDLFSGTVLVAKDGKPFFRKVYGIANKDFNAPNRIDTKFNLGSMNKMFTSVAIAQLVERGKLSFDDPLAKLLPEYPDKESAQKIKIKHLLSHTAGLGSYFNQKFFESSRENYRTVDDMMKLAEGEKLSFEPGTRWAYSNTGMLVLGKVIEKVTGQSYFDYIRENIYRPAGMTNSDSYELDKVNPNLAVGYEKEYADDGIHFSNNIFQHVMRGGPAGGGYSTVDDLFKFDVALRSGKLVGQEMVKTLLSAKPELNSPEYGYGFQIDKELSIAGHGGGFPGISSNLDMFLSNGYTAAVMSNYGFAAIPVSQKIRELVVAGQVTQNAKR
ncbi:MAG TPA: serine hydrolase domain-containing protein [Blastocatellia bacterium]|nr:serine hydrolase domain-containing protein [Blastocatellia bacterium]